MVMADLDSLVGPGTRSFTVRGMRNGSPVRVTWNAGALTGDPPTHDRLQVEADIAEVGSADPLTRPFLPGTGPLLAAEILADPEQSLALIRTVLDRVTEVAAGT
jgi:hypothetical protein